MERAVCRRLPLEKSRCGQGINQARSDQNLVTLMPQFVGLNFQVHNGHKFIPVTISEEMVGHKLGEFAPTRSYFGHGADKKARRS